MHCFIPFLFKFVKWLRADTCLHRSDRIANAKSCLPAAGWIFACFVTFQCDRTQAQHTSASKYTHTGTQTGTQTHNNKLLHTSSPSSNILALDQLVPFARCTISHRLRHISLNCRLPDDQPLVQVNTVEIRLQ